MPTVDELREEIQAACDEVIGDGLLIGDSDWGVEWSNEDGAISHSPCVCPLGALAIVKNIVAEVDEDGVKDADVVIARHLGVKADNLIDFINGFDDTALAADNSEFTNLGREFRAKYIESKP